MNNETTLPTKPSKKTQSLTKSLEELHTRYDKLYLSYKEMQGEMSRLKYEHSRAVADKMEMIEKERNTLIYKIKAYFLYVFTGKL